MIKSAFAAVSLIAALLLAIPSGAYAAETQVQRGKYLISIIPCTDCHTPGTFLGKPDMKRYLGGSEVGFEVPGLGRVLRLQPHAGRRDRHRQMDQGADRHRDHRRKAAGRAHPRAADAGRIVQEPEALGRAGDRRLSEEPAADQEQGARARSGRAKSRRRSSIRCCRRITTRRHRRRRSERAQGGVRKIWRISADRGTARIDRLSITSGRKICRRNGL